MLVRALTMDFGDTLFTSVVPLILSSQGYFVCTDSPPVTIGSIRSFFIYIVYIMNQRSVGRLTSCLDSKQLKTNSVN